MNWRLATFLLLVCLTATRPASAADLWLDLAGGEGPGKGTKVVLISGDEEYRSEEALTQLAKILATHHGFDCRVVYAIDPKTGEISPNTQTNIPGLEALQDADLMVIATRFRNLPDEQMQEIDSYLKAGKPVIGMRTATHAFNIPAGRAFARYGWKHDGKDFSQGFGRQVLGETWINHHGHHGKESTRGLIAPDPAKRFPSAEDADHTKMGAANFHRQLIVGGLASEYENEIRAWLDEFE